MCDMQQIAHEIAHEIAQKITRVISPLANYLVSPLLQGKGLSCWIGDNVFDVFTARLSNFHNRYLWVNNNFFLSDQNA
jgi:hypothetical protein